MDSVSTTALHEVSARVFQIAQIFWSTKFQTLWSNLAYRVFTVYFADRETWRRSILLSTTNKMQRYTIFFIIVNAVHVSGGFSAYHQELKNCTHSNVYVPGLLAATAVAASKPGIYPMLCVQFLSS